MRKEWEYYMKLVKNSFLDAVFTARPVTQPDFDRGIKNEPSVTYIFLYIDSEYYELSFAPFQELFFAHGLRYQQQKSHLCSNC